MATPVRIARVASDWPLTGTPNEQKVGLDVEADIAGRHELTVPDLTGAGNLDDLTGMWDGMRVKVTSQQRVFVYLGAGAGLGWAGLPKQYRDIANAAAALTALTGMVNGDTVYVAGTVLMMYEYLYGAWRPRFQPHTSVVQRAFGADNTFTNQTAYAVFPVSADKTALDVAFTKLATPTLLVVRVFGTALMTSGVAQALFLGIQIGGTNYPVAQNIAGAASSPANFAGVAVIPTIAAGALTCTPIFKATTGSTVTFTSGSSFASVEITETM